MGSRRGRNERQWLYRRYDKGDANKERCGRRSIHHTDAGARDLAKQAGRVVALALAGRAFVVEWGDRFGSHRCGLLRRTSEMVGRLQRRRMGGLPVHVRLNN
jgi:hypothetical protein